MARSLGAHRGIAKAVFERSGYGLGHRSGVGERDGGHGKRQGETYRHESESFHRELLWMVFELVRELSASSTSARARRRSSIRPWGSTPPCSCSIPVYP